jgi:hypothetical protein
VATEKPILLDSMNATADLSAKQFFAVKVDASNDEAVVICSVQGERAYGILQNNPKAGWSASAMVAGISKAVYGGTVTRGDQLMVDANGRLITQTGTNVVVGIARVSGVVNQVGSVLLK